MHSEVGEPDCADLILVRRGASVEIVPNSGQASHAVGTPALSLWVTSSFLAHFCCLELLALNLARLVV